jgi:flagellar motor switch protein FliM
LHPGPREYTLAELANDIAPLAANSLLRAGEAQFLLSVEAKAVLRMIDRAFGGRGAVPAQMPVDFPLSAELMIARLETLIGGAISAALGNPAPITALRRNGSLEKLSAFADDTELAVQTCCVTEADGTSWQAILAFPLSTLPALFGHCEQAPGTHPPTREPRDPLAGPCADLPLNLRAVLVDMAIPVSALSALEPGSVLPVAVARSVPLTVCGATVAHGTVGAQDDCIAIQITHAFR